VNVEFTITLSFEDFLACQRLIVRRTRTWKHGGMWILSRGLPLAGIGFFIGIQDTHSGVVGVLIGPLIGFAISAAIYLFSSISLFWRLPKQSRKIFFAGKTLRPPKKIIIDDAGIKTDNGVEKYECGWSVFPHWMEDEKSLIICRTGHLFLYIPKKQVSHNIINDLREALINANVKKI